MTKTAYAQRARQSELTKSPSPQTKETAQSERGPSDWPAMLLQMQRTAGNQAVNQFIRQYRADEGRPPVQRAGGRGGAVAGPPVRDEEGGEEEVQEERPDAFDAVVAEARGQPAPVAVVDQGQEQEQQEAEHEQQEEVREALSPLMGGGISPDQPHVAKVVLRELAQNDDGGGEGPVAEAPGGGVQAEQQQALEARRLQGLKKAAIDRATLAQNITKITMDAYLAKQAGKPAQERASRRGLTGLLNTIVNKATMLLGMAPKATAIVDLFSKVSAAVMGVMNIIKAVATPVGLALGVVQGWLDLRSALSSTAKWRRLKNLAAKTLEQANTLKSSEETRAQGAAKQELSGAIKYAAGQKGAKAGKRWLAFAGGGAGIAAGVIGVGALLGVALAATPIGWALAGVGAAVGLGMMIYRIYKWNSKRKAKTLGVERHRNAEIIYKALRNGDPDAITAVVDDLDIPLKAALSPQGLALIERKLKSV
ncbi:MAG: hypothetical protein ACRDGS_01455 [Chloroflexota bacterium]